MAPTYCLGLDLDEEGAEEEWLEVEALRAHTDTLVAKVAGFERRLECHANHLGANVEDYHLGLDELACKTEKANAMGLLHQCGSKNAAHLTRRMREAMRGR